ncbi:hypothetical protein BJV82DRAFT_379866 [Fennellomyces sp. T-0311]|nr:hypothetical protein BJV82DRAFT_379866 [Fennellomyces sp. T-0311]
MVTDQSNFENGTLHQDLDAAADPLIERQLTIIAKALADEQYDQAISSASRLLIRCSSSIAARALELRASAWERKASLKNELEDALLLIEYDSNNVDAYLRAGKIHSIRGNQQKAIDILSQGLQICALDDHQALLTQHIAIVKAKAQRRIDFIAQAPYDVLCKILSYLDVDAVNTCMDTCRTWRSKVLECPESWRVMVTLGTNFWRSTRAVNLLPTISKHIETIDTYADPQKVAQLFDNFAKYDFSRLHTLIAYYTAHNGDFDISHSVNSGLPFVAQTLTELKLDSSAIAGISMGRILSICQKLTSIFLGVGSITECSDVVSLSHDTLLTAVKIWTLVPIATISNFKPLFQHSPRLRNLEIHSKEIGGDFLSVLEHHCPELAVISVQTFPIIGPFMNIARTKWGERLHHLSLYNIRSAEPLLPRLVSCHDALQAMKLMPARDEGNQRNWRPLSSFIFTGMTYLHINTSYNRAFCEHLPEILRACPSVETLEMENTRQDGDGVVALDADRIFNAIAEMSNLSCLKLTYLGIRGSAFKRLLDQHAMRGDGSMLRKLIIYWCDGLDGDILEAAGNVRSLERLEIRGPGRVYDNNALSFATSVSKLPRLSSLHIGEVVFTDEAAQVLATSKSLELLVLFDVHGLTQNGWKVLHDNIPAFSMIDYYQFT